MKNKILWFITNINALSFIFMMLAVDSDTWIPFIIMCVNLAWLMLFCIVNIDYFNRVEHDGKAV